MGYGSSSTHGNCPCQWRSEYKTCFIFYLFCSSTSSFLFGERYFQGEGPDWQDFVGIICLLVINSTISFIEENNAGTAAAALMARLAPRTKVTDLLLFITFTSILGIHCLCYKE